MSSSTRTACSLRGRSRRIPFQLTDADAGVDVILLAPYPKVIDFRIQTPTGFIIEPWRAIAEPAMTWLLSEGVSYYRLVLPTELFPARYDQAGTWRVLLSIGRPRTSPPEDVDVRRELGLGARPRGEAFETFRRMPPLREQGRGPEGVRGFEAAATHVPERRTLPFSVLVHTYSNLSLRVTAQQGGYQPGAQVMLVATLTEAGVPAREGASLWAELTRPDATTATIDLAEAEAGRFEGTFATSQAGVYRARVRASGRTRKGHPFQREHTVTAAVWAGGELAADPSSAAGGPLVQWLDEFDERICRLLNCLLAGGTLTPELERELRGAGVDLARLRRCLAAFCKRQARAGEEEDAPRQGRFPGELESLLASYTDESADDE